MRHNLFGKKLRSLFLIIFATLFVLPCIFNAMGLTSDVSAAASCEGQGSGCRLVKLFYPDGSLATSFTYTHNGATKVYTSSICTQDESASYFCNYTITVMDNSSNVVMQKTGSDQRTSGGTYIQEVRIYYGDGENDYIANRPTARTQTVEVPAPGQEGETPSSSGQGNVDGTEATCHTAAGGLGWILCPVLEAAAGAAKWAYESVIEPSLRIEPELFKTEDEERGLNGTYQAWQAFRDIANVIFVLFFLFVIFSQVTGFGIDNYGIKKTLPKLIVAAILVNISFYICQGLIDISNIAGSSVYSLINGLADGIKVEGGGIFQSGVTSALWGVLGIFIVAGAGTLIAGAAFWSSIGAGLFALVPALLSAVVAIILLFVLLAMRKAVVVVLVALAPLAFVAYALPNTKKLFDRWSEVLRGMLLLYPIAATLMAGGRLASNIIFASGGGDDLATALIAMVAEIVPLFLIPSITRSAYRATGALGATINRLSSRATAGTRKGVQNSGAYKRTQGRIDNFRAQQRMNGRRMRRYEAAAEAERNGNATRLQHFTALMGRHRAAAVKQAAVEAGKKQGDIDAWAAAGNDGKDIAKGARVKARIDTGQQLVNTADYATATFENAVIKENDTEHKGRVERQLMWNQSGYKEGKENADTVARVGELESTRMWTGGDYIQGKLSEAALGREGESRRMGLYTNNEYIRSRRQAQEAGISNEITKMYSDQFSRMSMSDVMGALNNSITRTDVKNRKEQFAAASQALIQMGQADKVREIISGGKKIIDPNTGEEKTEYADAAEKFGDLVQKDQDFRNRAAQVLGSSGEFTFQEYAKHLGQSNIDRQGRSNARSFQEWSDATDGRSLAASIQAKGLDRIDKDGFNYLAGHLNALQGASDSNIAKVAASTTDAATIAKLADAIGRLDPTRRASIMDATSGAQFVNMNETIRVAISGGGVAGDNAWKARISDSLNADPQLRGRLNSTEQGRYINPQNNT